MAKATAPAPKANAYAKVAGVGKLAIPVAASKMRAAKCVVAETKVNATRTWACAFANVDSTGPIVPKKGARNLARTVVCAWPTETACAPKDFLANSANYINAWQETRELVWHAPLGENAITEFAIALRDTTVRGAK